LQKGKINDKIDEKGKERNEKKIMKKHGVKISERIKSYAYKIENRMNGRDFTRKSKLGFVASVLIILNFAKKSVQIEVNNFIKRVLGKAPGVKRQSFEDSRKKISENAFIEIFEVSVEDALELEDADLYKAGSIISRTGYRVSVIDGSTLKLENSEELCREYGQSTPCEGQVFARVSVVYDVLNDFISDADIQPFSVGERKMAMSQIEKLITKDKCANLFVMDRGYWSPELATKIHDSGNKFLMRIQKTTSKTIRNDANNSGVFKVKYDGVTYKFRFFKFILPSGELEILATNLPYDEASDENLAELYCLRWGIESKYKLLKCLLSIEAFTGKSKLVVRQDFFATVYLCNILSFACMASDEMIVQNNINKRFKNIHVTNRAIAISLLKDEFVKIIIDDSPRRNARKLKQLLLDISKFDSSVGRKREGKRDNNALKSKPHRKFKQPL